MNKRTIEIVLTFTCAKDLEVPEGLTPKEEELWIDDQVDNFHHECDPELVDVDHNELD